jgi:hypothetical protein
MKFRITENLSKAKSPPILAMAEIKELGDRLTSVTKGRKISI